MEQPFTFSVITLNLKSKCTCLITLLDTKLPMYFLYLETDDSFVVVVFSPSSTQFLDYPRLQDSFVVVVVFLTSSLAIKSIFEIEIFGGILRQKSYSRSTGENAGDQKQFSIASFKHLDIYIDNMHFVQVMNSILTPTIVKRCLWDNVGSTVLLEY